MPKRKARRTPASEMQRAVNELMAARQRPMGYSGWRPFDDSAPPEPTQIVTVTGIMDRLANLAAASEALVGHIEAFDQRLRATGEADYSKAAEPARPGIEGMIERIEMAVNVGHDAIERLNGRF